MHTHNNERAYVLTDVQSRQAELMGSGATAVTCLIQKRRRRCQKQQQAEGEEQEVRMCICLSVCCAIYRGVCRSATHA